MTRNRKRKIGSRAFAALAASRRGYWKQQGSRQCSFAASRRNGVPKAAVEARRARNYEVEVELEVEVEVDREPKPMGQIRRGGKQRRPLKIPCKSLPVNAERRRKRSREGWVRPSVFPGCSPVPAQSSASLRAASSRGFA